MSWIPPVIVPAIVVEVTVHEQTLEDISIMILTFRVANGASAKIQ
jgi:hypothetical protein